MGASSFLPTPAHHPVMTSNQKRQPSGTPIGGQFATSARAAASGVDLNDHRTLSDVAFDDEFGPEVTMPDGNSYWEARDVRAALAEGRIEENQVWSAYDTDDSGVGLSPGMVGSMAFGYVVTTKPWTSHHIDVTYLEGDDGDDDAE